MQSYRLRRDQMYDEEIGRYIAFGIDIYENDTLIKTVKDITIKKEKLLKLIHLLNRLQPDILHFEDIIEDFIT